MVDFIKISTRPGKKGCVEIFPKFIVGKSKDLMIRGGDFYAIWLEDRGVWSTDEQDVIDTVDSLLEEYAKNYKREFNVNVKVLYMWDSDSGVIDDWHKYVQRQMRDNYKTLNENLVFANQEISKDDYSTKRLNYTLEPGELTAYNELMETLYTPENIHKIEWCIGAIVTGASKYIHKFLVLYGAPGTGKSTVINIIQKMFDGYYNVFDAKALGSSSDAFALEPFKNNPLIAIQHDADLSRIEDNTRLNSIVSHELMTVNEKHKALYSSRFISFLIIGTNKPVKITDSKSGVLRRLIDVNPTGKKLTMAAYNRLVSKIDFELGNIAYHCKEVFEADPNYYDNYVPVDMMGESNDFFNFMEDSYIVFKRDNKTTLKEAWGLYKIYCEQAKVPYPFSMRTVKSELKAYFDHYDEDFQDPKTKEHIRNLYSGFRYKIFGSHGDKAMIVEDKKTDVHTIEFVNQPSVLDEVCKDCTAQYATAAETPGKKWDTVTTSLKDLVTTKLHYVKLPENLIVIDFDLKDSEGKKSYEKNLEAASKWPKTYAELSKSGSGIHLHYWYDGDPAKLSRIYDDSIEIKVFTGNSSLRRKLTKCNNEQINHISSGLPLKGNADKMENIDVIKSEKALRTMIKRNLNKEYHGATKPSIDFIYKILEDAYTSGLKYDVSDLYNPVLAFAAGSTHQAEYCLALVPKMHFKSDEKSDSVDDESKPIVFFDLEVFPNLLLINWKRQGAPHNVVRMINPSPQEVEELLNYRLVGFNNRRYDNHILYARLLGRPIEEIYKISQGIVTGNKMYFFGEAYNLSYTDIYDYCSADNKMSLKAWEIKLGIHHLELGLPWDKPVPEEMWPKVAEYCDNDVISTEAVWEATQDDFTARKILAEIAGMSANDTTNSLTTRIIFGHDKNPQLVYTDLSEEFPGYKFVKEYIKDTGKYARYNMYRDVDLSLGGYVYSEPGMYENVALLDVESLHPHSAIALNAFGEYTKKFEELVEARMLIKHGEYDKAKELFDGKLAKYLTNKTEAKKLAKALKTAINSVYGLTSAKFANPFRDIRNENNIIALRGALFMKTLQDEVVKRGFKVIHIKTDSIKIPNATPEIIEFCMKFAKKYKYNFEHEATYKKICLVNDAVYIARYMTKEECTERYGYVPEKNEKNSGKWTATGTQFQIPYVFKKCFSKEKIIFDDLCETKQVQTAMYLDYNEGKQDTKKLEQELYCIIEGNREPERQEELKKIIEESHDRRFVGRVGLFCPIKAGCGGAELVVERAKDDGTVSYNAVVGTKGYRWLESENVRGKCEENIDMSYYEELANDAIDDINKYGDYYAFIS